MGGHIKPRILLVLAELSGQDCQDGDSAVPEADSYSMPEALREASGNVIIRND